jgi:hypothetical protein
MCVHQDGCCAYCKKLDEELEKSGNPEGAIPHFLRRPPPQKKEAGHA